MNPSVESGTVASRTARWRALFAELTLLLFVCGVLVWLATPLGHPVAVYGLDGRYFSPEEPVSWWDLWLRALGGSRENLSAQGRAVLLVVTAGYWLSALAIGTFVLIQLLRLGVRWARPSMLAVIGVGLVLWRPNSPGGLCTGGLLASLGLLSALRLNFTRMTHGATSYQVSDIPQRWLVLPGWTLLTGLGWLWIADFAARGPKPAAGNGAALLGVLQADGIVAADIVLLLAVAYGHAAVRQVAQCCSGLARTARSRLGSQLLAAAASVAVLLLGWLGHRQTPGLPLLHIPGAGRPYIAGELVRVAAVVAIAWWCYRVGEWQISGTAARRSVFALVASGLACIAALILAGDMGPVVIIVLASALLVPPTVIRNALLLGSPDRRQFLVLGAALATGCLAAASIWLWNAGLVNVAPLLSNTAQERELGRQMPFRASSPNLAQVKWLTDAASSTEGFGLGRVPYCGARAAVGSGACTLASGAPLQLASDMAFAGLVATWGWTVAAAIAAGLMFWLRILMLAAAPPAHSHGHDPAAVDSLDWLRAWLVSAAAVAAMVQSLTSLGGTLGWTPLTGVTLPLLSFGSSSLCCMGAWTGLALAPHFSGRAVLGHQGH